MMGWMTAPLLLALTFANGVGLAMRWPVFAAIVPEVVPRAQLPAALALNGVAMNASRIIGPLVAGALIAAPAAPGCSCSTPCCRCRPASSSCAGAACTRKARWAASGWPAPCASACSTSGSRAACAPCCCASRCSSCIPPPCWRCCRWWRAACRAAQAGTFTVLLASMGAGAIVAALQMPRIRKLLPPQTLLFTGTALQAGAALVVAFAPSIYVAVPAMVVRRHGLDHGGQLAHGGGPDGLARLGARARHVDLPDGPDGLHRRGRGAVGPGRHLDQHPRRPGDRLGIQRRADGPGPARWWSTAASRKT